MDTNMMVTPNIQGMANVMSATKMQNDIGTAVLSKALDTFQDNGDEMVKMMEQSVNPNLGANFDMKV